MPDKRVHIYYEGAVQGVGFRISAERVAGSLALKGWVRNLDDGRVEVLCEGEEGDVKRFTEKIVSIFNRFISDVDIEWTDPSGEYETFDIRDD